MDNLCDKCGEEVPPENNAVNLEACINPKWILIFAQPRHLLPTENCEGSPSRAQYLEGQSRDMRGKYFYDESYEPIVREAYRKMQEKLGVKK
jgi:hypothetical protein